MASTVEALAKEPGWILCEWEEFCSSKPQGFMGTQRYWDEPRATRVWAPSVRVVHGRNGMSSVVLCLHPDGEKFGLPIRPSEFTKAHRQAMVFYRNSELGKVSP